VIGTAGYAAGYRGGQAGIMRSREFKTMCPNTLFVQRVPARIDFDRSPGQDFNAEGPLKPGLSLAPDVRLR
jgi:hypothetical protein